MKKILFALLAFSLLLFGCTGGDSKVPERTNPFVGGIQAFSMEFVNGMPPEYIFDNGGYDFGIGLRLKNTGEYDISASEGYIEIIGINPKDFGKSNQNDLKKILPNDISGAKKNFDGTILAGGETIVEFGDLKYLPNLNGNTGVKIRANLCFDYTTMTSTQICVKKDLLSNKEAEAEICQLSGDKIPKNSGGPIHITKVTENPMGSDKIQISFIIQHVGTHPGAIFFKYTEDECDTSITNTNKYKVHIDITSDVDGKKPSCNGLEDAADGNSEGFITLFDGQPRTVTCQIDTSSVDSVYEDLLEINLKYKYMMAIEKPLEIKDVSTDN
jgi:hypothetical protein